MDLYLWTGVDFADPSLLFYAGPVYDEETDNIHDQEGELSNEVRMHNYVSLCGACLHGMVQRKRHAQRYTHFLIRTYLRIGKFIFVQVPLLILMLLSCPYVHAGLHLVDCWTGGHVATSMEHGWDRGNLSQSWFPAGFQPAVCNKVGPHIKGRTVLLMLRGVSNRQGSQFQIRYGVRTGDLGSPGVMGDSNNGSLLFRTSNRTAFLLGGWPSGAQVSIL